VVALLGGGGGELKESNRNLAFLGATSRRGAGSSGLVQPIPGLAAELKLSWHPLAARTALFANEACLQGNVSSMQLEQQFIA